MYLSVLERDIRRRADRLNRCCFHPAPPRRPVYSCLLIQGLIPCGIISEILAWQKASESSARAHRSWHPPVEVQAGSSVPSHSTGADIQANWYQANLRHDGKLILASQNYFF